MPSNGRKTSAYDVHQWLKKLHAYGWRTYYHADLPAWLQNERYQHSVSCGSAVQATGKFRRVRGSHTKEWKIRDDIMTISSNRIWR